MHTHPKVAAVASQNWPFRHDAKCEPLLKFLKANIHEASSDAYPLNLPTRVREDPIFETLAKLVFNSPNVENQTLASLFDGYRKRSELPEPLLDYILETYKRRNVEPLAGHGATKPPTVSAKEAAVLVEMTKMCVRLERRLALQEIDAVPAADGSLKSAPNAAGSSNPPPTQLAKPIKWKSTKIKAVRNKLAAK